MERIPVESSNLYSVGYSNGMLEVEFCHGGVYRYFGVPSNVYDELLDAESKGSYFYHHIRLGGYKWEKIC